MRSELKSPCPEQHVRCHRALGSGETVWLLGAMVGLTGVWSGWLIYCGAYAETVCVVGAGALSLLYPVESAGAMVGNALAPVLLRLRSLRRTGSLSAVVIAAIAVTLAGCSVVQMLQRHFAPTRLADRVGRSGDRCATRVAVV